jgi:hypothetical protein
VPAQATKPIPRVSAPAPTPLPAAPTSSQRAPSRGPWIALGVASLLALGAAAITVAAVVVLTQTSIFDRLTSATAAPPTSARPAPPATSSVAPTSSVPPPTGRLAHLTVNGIKARLAAEGWKADVPDVSVTPESKNTFIYVSRPDPSGDARKAMYGNVQLVDCKDEDAALRVYARDAEAVKPPSTG